MPERSTEIAQHESPEEGRAKAMFEVAVWDEFLGRIRGIQGKGGEGSPRERTPQDPLIPLPSWFESNRAYQSQAQASH